MARVSLNKSEKKFIFLAAIYLVLNIDNIDTAPQFSAQLKPFFSFQGFDVLAHNERDAFNAIDHRARPRKPVSAALKIEPVVVSTTGYTNTAYSTTLAPPPPPTSTAAPTLVVVG